MYSDSSSTTGSESEENFPGYIPIPMIDEETISATYGGLGSCDRAKMYQAYKGQLKLSAYVNYGLLTVHVMMGRHMKSKVKGTCDSYVKLSLIPDDTHRTACKTEVIHDTNSPLYDEKFSFELLDEDKPKRLFISVWNNDHTRNQAEFLGCMSFGIHHIQSKQKIISGWYYLLNGDIGRKKHLQVTDRKHLSERGGKAIAAVNQDVLWMEPRVISIKRNGKSGFGFTISGSCPVTVCRVEPGTAADISGVKGGDCIVKIDGLNVSRSTCDSVARIIKHSQKKIVLEVQRPKKVETTFKVEELDHSPRQPLCSSTPFSENNRMDENWKQPPSRRTLDTVIEEETPPTSPQKGYETQDYGWIDGGAYSGEEDIYVEPDEIRGQILQVPRDPPALPPNHPTLNRHRSHSKQLEDMDVSPWKPPSGRHSRQSHEENPYIPLDGVRQFTETDLDEGSESRYEWDYSDTKLNKFQEETMDSYGWIDSRWTKKPLNNAPTNSSGYSSSTLPRSMKLGSNKQRTSRSSIQRDYETPRDYEPQYVQQTHYRDDMALRRSTSAGAHGHGYREEKNHCGASGYRPDHRGYSDGYHQDEIMTAYSTGSSSSQGSGYGSRPGSHSSQPSSLSSHPSSHSSHPNSHGHHYGNQHHSSHSRHPNGQLRSYSSSTLPRQKKVSFKDFN